MSATKTDNRVYADLKSLVKLQLHAQGFSFLPRQAIHSILAGRHASRLRGRGLSFEELRDYRVGDDIRSLDWKTTNRMRKPHVRVYTEERERDVLLLVDQRSNMFFGSQQRMKSVTAAEAAALAIWRVLSVKDRIGALVFNDQLINKIRPRRSSNTAMQILHHIVELNHRLTASSGRQNLAQLNHVLQEAETLCGHDCLIVLISDMSGWNAETIARIKRLKAHNDLIVSMVYDPLEKNLTEQEQIVVSDGELQIELSTQDKDLKGRFDADFLGNIENLKLELSKYNIPILPLNTVTPVYKQLRQALSAAQGQTKGLGESLEESPEVSVVEGLNK